MASSSQRGVYAVEFALIFPLFFLIIYATLIYGLVFTAQQSLDYAAQSGARAALQWPDCTDTNLSALQCRAQTAQDTAQKYSSWMGALGGDVVISVCGDSGDSQLASCGALTASPGADPLRVTVSYHLGAPLLGPDSLMGFAVPSVLTAAAQVDLAIAQGVEGGS